MIRTLFVLLLASVSVAAPVPKGMKAKPPTMDGRWELVEQIVTGKNDPNFAKWMWEIDGEQLAYRRPDGQGVYQPDKPNANASLKPAVDGKPGEFDYLYSKGGTTYRSLITLDGDDMIVCLRSGGGKDYPTEPKAGANVEFYRFKRSEK